MSDTQTGQQNYTRWFGNYPSTHALAGQTVEVTPVRGRLVGVEAQIDGQTVLLDPADVRLIYADR